MKSFKIILYKQNIYFQHAVRLGMVLTAHSTAPQIVKQEHATQ